MMRTLEISNRHRSLRIDRRKLTKALAILDAAADRFDGGCPPGELSLAFLDDAELAELHGEFLEDPTTTDVITFEGDPAFGVAGEVCVSVDTARTYAKKHRRAFSEELLLYVVHGWLHLAGYDDLKPELKRAMRRAEARAMKLLTEAGLCDAFELKKPVRR
jgi:probable rRNA maturation factor